MTDEAVWSPPDPVACPVCHRTTGLAIVYGMPDGELMEAAENGQVALGGCVIFADQPDFRCSACGHAWCVDE